ncbi:MAG: alpha-L-fucosidase, partial [Tannerella sp.]|nr:alpha-L-fucosidase [Tannerella sp.]
AEHYKGAPWVIHNLIDCVAKGGSFMVCLGPDEFGKFHPKAVEQLEEVGRWLKVNGKGIYETRLRDVWKEGDIWFTRSKDSKQVYAFVNKFPEKELIIQSVTPKKGSKVYLFWLQKSPEMDTDRAGRKNRNSRRIAIARKPSLRTCLGISV